MKPANESYTKEFKCKVVEEYINGITVTYGENRVCTVYIKNSSQFLSASHSLPVGIDNIEFSPLYDTDYIYGEESEEESIIE